MAKKRFQVHGETVTIAPNMVFSGTDFSGADLTRANFSGCRLISVNFTGTNLSGANLTAAEVYSKQVRSDFSGTNLTGAALNKATIKDADFTGADLTGAIFRSTNFRGVTLDNAILTKTRGTLVLGGSSARTADFSETSYASVLIDNSLLDGACLRSAFWRGVEIYESSLRTVNAPGAKLLHAHLDRCDLGNAVLTGLISPRLHVRSGSLCGADLKGADLKEANIAHTNLQDCVLDNANLRDAKIIIPEGLPRSLKGADLNNVLWPNYDDIAADLPSGEAPDWSLAQGRRLRRSLSYLNGLHPQYQSVLALLYTEHPGASTETLVALARAAKADYPPATAGSNAISLYPLVDAFSAPR